MIKDNKSRTHGLNVIGLIFGFIFLMFGLCLSVYLILKGWSIAGSVFTGFTLLMGAGLLVARKMPARKMPKKEL